MRTISKSAVLILLVLACWVLAGCSKNGLSGNDRGIRFVATAGPAATRIAYSGEEETVSGSTDKAERLDWVKGDEFTIWSNHARHIQDEDRHTANYIVQHVETDGLRSRATVDPSDHNGLQKTIDADDYVFYGRYPKDPNQLTANPNLTGTEMTGFLPFDQSWDYSKIAAGMFDMQYAYMFASATAKSDAKKVELDFYPMFTVLKFMVLRGENETVSLTSFTLSSSSQAITGPFEVSCPDFDPADPKAAVSPVTVTTTDDPKKITVDLDGVVLNEAHPSFIFSVVALPMDLTDLTISFEGTEIGTRSLALNYSDDPQIPGAVANSPIVFKACRKHFLKNISFPKIVTAEEGEDEHQKKEDIIWDLESMTEILIWDND